MNKETINKRHYTKDIPANSIAVGNPCKVMREINDNDKTYYYKNLKVE